ncbi:MAG: twin-arginine translocase subunit TatC [Candidatus Hydrothermarchaeota archaeon]
MEEKRMPIWEHLEELRRRILISAGAVLLFAIITFPLTDDLLEQLKNAFLSNNPAFPGGIDLVVLAPMEAIFVRFKMAVVLGLALALPVIMYEGFKFIAPGLYPKEKRFILSISLFWLFLSLFGLAFAIFLVIPLTFKFILRFALPFATPELRLEYFVTFILYTALGCIAIAQLPLVMGAISYLGFVTPQQLKSYRRYAIVILAIITAIVTPDPTGITMIFELIPLLFLYEVGIQVAKIARR